MIMNGKVWILVGIVLVFFTGFVVVLVNSNPPTDTSGTLSQTMPIPTMVTRVQPTGVTGTIKKMDKLTIEDVKVGSGSAVKAGDTVVMHYTGYLTNGKKFDSSLDRGQPFTTEIGVGAVIKGWDQGVPGMKVGGKRKLMIPAELGYGSRGAGSAIPPNADLVFEVELLEIK
jgi:FKBP-type peptidyl-prolyl cis-trans isomerase